MDFRLQLQHEQKLILTQELRQSIEMLQYTGMELEEHLRKIADENPLLELETRRHESLDDVEKNFDEADYAAFLSAGTIADESYPVEKKNYDFLDFYKEDTTLREHLLRQAGVEKIPEELRRAVLAIIDSIDRRGYLSESVDTLASALYLSTDQVEKALHIVQAMDPVGVGARNLSECLALQLPEDAKLARAITENHLELVATNHPDRIASVENVDLEDVLLAVDVIKGLNPIPGQGYSTEMQGSYVFPEGEIVETKEGFEVHLFQEHIPRLYINHGVERLLQRSNDEGAVLYLKKKRAQAIFAIRSLEQRGSTIRAVLEAVVRRQESALRKGMSFLEPMRLKDLADELQLSESTISRATSGKYVITPHGMVEIKSFFTNALGDDISSARIKAVLQKLVESENKKKPHSDAQLVKLLTQSGFEISRRTVAKYRDEMQIPNSTRRKQF